MAVTVQQIAEEAGVSRGTVDRVLHERGKVKPEIAQNIREIAQRLGYYDKMQRAMAAKLSAADFRLGIVLTSMETPTMGIVAAGAQAAREKLCNMGAQVHIHLLEQLDPQRIVACIDELAEQGINALAIAPSSDPMVCERLNALAEAGVAIATLNGDLPGCKRLCYVGMDNWRGGRVAAGLMHLLLPEGGKVLPITAHLTHYAHKQRYTSFYQEMQEHHPEIEVLPLQSCFNRDDFAQEIVLHAVEEHPDLRGVYVAANGTRGVCDALAQCGLTGRVRVVAYDLNDQNREDLMRGRISALLDQAPFEQGYQPPFLLYRHLIEGTPVPQELAYTKIDIQIREML